MSDMPAVAQRPVADSEPTVRPISVAELYRMEEAGIFAAGERVELLAGELIAVPRVNPPHAYVVQRLGRAEFLARFSGVACARIQLPIRIDDFTELMPDLALCAPPDERYAAAHPSPTETLLLVEVADRSLRYDSGPKLRAYARAPVVEYWILDLLHDRLEVRLDPHGDRYRQHRTHGRGALVAPAAFPDVAIAVDDLLPPRAA